MTPISPNKLSENTPFTGTATNKDGKTELTGTLIHKNRTYKVTVRYSSESLSNQYGEQDLDKRVSALVNALKDQMENIAGSKIKVSLNKPSLNEPRNVTVKKGTINQDKLDAINTIFKNGLPFSKPTLLMKSPIDPVGIQNIGNSCYMNSSLQALFSSNHFLSHVNKFLEEKWDTLSDSKDEDKKKNEVIFRLVGLMNSLHEKDTVRIPSRARALRDSFFLDILPKGQEKLQQDAPELVGGILDILDLKFKITTTTTILGASTSKTPEYGIYQIVIKNESLQENLNEAFQRQENTDIKNMFQVGDDAELTNSAGVTKLLFGNDEEKEAASKELFGNGATLVKIDKDQAIKYKNEDGEFYVLLKDIKFLAENKISYKKRVLKWSTQDVIETPPPFLVVQLKCFNVAMEKIDKTVTIPEDGIVKIGDSRYQITGIVSHQGEGIDKGHYIAHVKKGESWKECNDDHTSSNIKDLNQHLTSTKLTPYLFVLERIEEKNN